MSAFVFSKIVTHLPPVIARHQINFYLGGAISPKTLANADSKGQGPSGKFKIGRTVVYPTESLLKWLENRKK
ncbi:MAG: hypothetical protein HQK67_12255 [Desulfamplus sp.]|nr:hypothetical protein [Desulfamplus sp.]